MALESVRLVAALEWQLAVAPARVVVVVLAQAVLPDVRDE